ncbi:MAG: carboxypeptidase-like regulatory domain-containing protein [Gemmatimonadaceae bacterium]
MASALAAQEPATVTGRVRATGGAALVGATVTIPQLGLGAITREDGRYSIVLTGARLAGQALTLAARRVGYKPASRPVQLTAGTNTQDFVLEDNPLQLGEVVITGAGMATEAEKVFILV